jgi:hypothetical protein
VGDAELIRSMIHDNVGKMLDPLITTENFNWGICNGSRNLLIKNLNDSTLNIDFKKRVAATGLTYVKHEIKKTKSNGYIEPRCLLAIKYINYLL